MSIRVVIAEEHLLLLDGLTVLLEEHDEIRVVGTSNDGEAAIAIVLRETPDVLVVGQCLAKISGLGVLRELRLRAIETPVVLLASDIRHEDVMEALRLDVSGVLLKTMPGRLFVQCVQKVAGGGQWIEKDSMHRALQQMLRIKRCTSEHATTLSVREMDVIREVSLGLRNREVAAKLFICESTVKVHLSNIYEKLGLVGRTALSVYAQEKGLV